MCRPAGLVVELRYRLYIVDRTESVRADWDCVAAGRSHGVALSTVWTPPPHSATLASVSRSTVQLRLAIELWARVVDTARIVRRAGSIETLERPSVCPSVCLSR